MFPDGANSKTEGVFYVWDEGKQEWIKIGNLANAEIIGQKKSVWKRFWRKIRSLFKVV